MAGGMLGGRQRSGRYKPLAEINVTPLVDVMLVLLIIFMVTAPLLSNAVNVDLPKAAASEAPQDDKPLNVSVTAEGKIFLMDEEITVADLVAKLGAIAKDAKDRRIYVRGDKGIGYGKMLEVMGAIITGGFTKVSLMTDPSGLAPAAPAAPTPPPAPAVPGKG